MAKAAAIKRIAWLVALNAILIIGQAQKENTFKVLAFFTAKNDLAHISFVHEANKWFAKQSTLNHFKYDSTDDWTKLNTNFLSSYQVVIFLDTRPEAPEQRTAFEKYMKNGGAWMGFHFAAFALSPSAYPQNWDWYHNQFIGAGQYKSNTWRPTPAVLHIENSAHPVAKDMASRFKSSPNEWYRWENDLRKNPDIDILLAVDPSSFPLGTGPKPHEIWHSGYYPVVWTNKKYKMLYLNMGHNDIDYEGGTNKELSFQFDNPVQSKLILNGLLWLGRGVAPGGSKNTTITQNKLDGTWIPVQQEIGGKAIPAAAFEKQRLIIKDSTYQFSAESVDKGVVKYNADKMDIYGREGVNTGKHFTAIYKYENDQLFICYNLKGDAYPEGFETKGHPLYFLCVFKRE